MLTYHSKPQRQFCMGMFLFCKYQSLFVIFQSETKIRVSFSNLSLIFEENVTKSYSIYHTGMWIIWFTKMEILFPCVFPYETPLSITFYHGHNSFIWYLWILISVSDFFYAWYEHNLELEIVMEMDSP